MAKVIVNIGQTLQLQVVAEGVERQEQVESLRALGCDSAQGFHLGRPMSAQDAVELAAGLRGGNPGLLIHAPHRPTSAPLLLTRP